MSMMLSGLLIVVVVAVGAAGLWGYRYYRQGSDSDALADTGAGPVDDTGAPNQAVADGLDGLTGPDESSTPGDSNADPVTAFELDPEAWAPLAQRGQRMARLRGVMRGANQAARLVGEPDVLFEHREGTIAVGLDAERPYQGHPEWREVSTLTLQMGIAKLRWPKADVTGVIRYTDCTVSLPYKQALDADLRRAARSHKGKALPAAEELSGADAQKPMGNRATGQEAQSEGLLTRLRSALAERCAHLVPRRYQRQ